MNNRTQPQLALHEPITDILEEIELTDFKKSPPYLSPNSLATRQNNNLSLYYLKDFKETEIASFEKHYDRTRYELETLIEKHRTYYWFDVARYTCDTGTNIPWIYYSIMTGKAGIQGFAKVINPDAQVSDATANTVGAALTTTGTMSFIFYTSPIKCAALSTLAYATRDPIYQRIPALIDAAKKDPKQAAKDSLASLAHTSLLGTTYFTVGMSEIIPFMDSLNQLPSPVKWLVMGGIQYFACRYMDTYMTKEYYNGVTFWKNEEKREYLFEKIKRGEIAIPLQVFFQGIISTVGLRAFPNYYFIAEAAAKALGGYIPSPLVASLVAIHGLCSLYPTTFNNYILSDEKADTLLNSKIDWNSVNQRFVEQIKQLNLATLSESELNNLKRSIVSTILQYQLPQLGDKAHAKLDTDEIYTQIKKNLDKINLTGLSETEQHTFQKLIADSIVQAEKDLLVKKTRNEIGYLGLFKQEPWSALTVGWQGAIGAYFGAKFMAPLFIQNPPLALTVVSGIAGASLFAVFAHRAETNRVINNLNLDELLMTRKKMEEAAKKAAEEKKNESTTAAKVLAGGLVTAFAASSTMSTIGSNSLLGTPSPLFNTFIASAATQSGLNSISYIYPGLANTLTGVINGIVDSCKIILPQSGLATTKSTLFGSKDTKTAEKETTIVTTNLKLD
jgi:hypothetical protein